MKTMPLRDLVRQPKAVKKLTAAGKSVRVTDNGQPLWVVTPDLGTAAEDDAAARTRLWEEHFADLLKAPLPSPIAPTLSQVVIDARGNR